MDRFLKARDQRDGVNEEVEVDVSRTALQLPGFEEHTHRRQIAESHQFSGGRLPVKLRFHDMTRSITQLQSHRLLHRTSNLPRDTALHDEFGFGIIEFGNGLQHRVNRRPVHIIQSHPPFDSRAFRWRSRSDLRYNGLPVDHHGFKAGIPKAGRFGLSRCSVNVAVDVTRNNAVVRGTELLQHAAENAAHLFHRLRCFDLWLRFVMNPSPVKPV